MKKLFPSLVFTCLALIAQPALAEWEYTRWGMTPTEVQKASSGEAVPVSAPPADLTSSEEGKTLLKSRWSLEQYDFDVYFNFSGTPAALTEVILISRSNNQDIVSALTRKYGPPVTAQGNLRMQRRRNFTLIPSNPDERVPPSPAGDLSAQVQWQTERDVITLSRQDETVTISFVPNQ